MENLTKMFDGKQLRIIDQNNEPWFVAKDICDILEIKNSRDAVSRLDDDEKASVGLTDGSQKRNVSIVNEFGLYNLVLSSRKPEAKEFKRWVTHDVIPSIRKTGSYDIKTEQLSPELQMFNGLFQSLAKQELATKQLESKVDGIRDVVALNTVDWRKDARQLISKIAKSQGGYGAYQEVNRDIYQEVERRGGFKLNVRLTNKRRRLADEGAPKSKRDNLSKVDVIADDKRLVEIYIAVVKEFAIKYGIDVGDSIA